MQEIVVQLDSPTEVEDLKWLLFYIYHEEWPSEDSFCDSETKIESKSKMADDEKVLRPVLPEPMLAEPVMAPTSLLSSRSTKASPTRRDDDGKEREETTKNEPVVWSKRSDRFLRLLCLADKFSFHRAAKTCCAELCKNMTLATTYRILLLPESLFVTGFCASLRRTHQAFLLRVFEDFDQMWQTSEFFDLPFCGLCDLLASSTLRTDTDNTVYVAARAWWHWNQVLKVGSAAPGSTIHTGVDQKSRPLVAEVQSERSGETKGLTTHSVMVKHPPLLFSTIRPPSYTKEQKNQLERLASLIRFDLMTPDFFLDVVMHDNWLTEIATREIFTKALLRHASSESRMTYLMPEFRRGAREATKTPRIFAFSWQMLKVSTWPLDSFAFSSSFYVGGYWFRFQSARKLSPLSPHPALGLWLSVDLERTGLTPDASFYLSLFSQFSFRNVTSGKLEATHCPSRDFFLPEVHELGYFNVFNTTWYHSFERQHPFPLASWLAPTVCILSEHSFSHRADLTRQPSKWIDDNDSLFVTVTLSFSEDHEKAPFTTVLASPLAA